MKNVSFGRIKCFKETQNITNSQQYALKYARRVFAPHPTIPFRYGTEEKTGLELSLDKALELKKNADIYITCKKNGNIELKVLRAVPGTENLEKAKYYVPRESKDNPLIVEVNPQLPLNRLNDCFRKFARRCEFYLRNGLIPQDRQFEKTVLQNIEKGE